MNLGGLQADFPPGEVSSIYIYIYIDMHREATVHLNNDCLFMNALPVNNVCGQVFRVGADVEQWCGTWVVRDGGRQKGMGAVVGAIGHPARFPRFDVSA